MSSNRVERAVQLFYSYASEDEGLRKKLEVHLSLLRRQQVIEDWHFRKIGAGVEWQNDISAHLEPSQIILLLISAYFMASDYCYDVEMARAMEKHESGEARVIPIILRPVDNWTSTPFGKLQARPENGKPITKWGNRDEAWADVAKGIREAAESIRGNLFSSVQENISPQEQLPSTQIAPPHKSSKGGMSGHAIMIPAHCNFLDVILTNEFREAIQFLCATGLVSGYADGTFRPENKMTRGQFAKIISNAQQFTEDPGTQIFEDVPPGNPFYIWINRLANRGFMQGFPCGTRADEPCVGSRNRQYFRPFDSLTREQLCEIVVRIGHWTFDATGGPHFNDVPLTNPFFQYVETAYNNDLMSALKEEYFGFGTPASRGETCNAVYRGIVKAEHFKMLSASKKQ